MPEVTIDDIVGSLDSLYKSTSPILFFDAWYEYKDDPNVLFIHYSDLFKNQEKYVKMIADFIGIKDLPEEALQKVLRRTSLPFMKQKNDRYVGMTGRDQSISMLKKVKEGGKLIRKGGVGTGRMMMSPETSQKLYEIGLKTLGKEKLKILEDGFEAA